MSRHVLLVEDEPNILEAISFILARDGWRVTTLSSGEAVLAEIRAGRPDIVVLDLMLPGRSGFEILQDLRADPVLCTLPVLMLTAKSQARDRDMAARFGATRFMTKPFANADILAALRDLADAE